MAQKSVLLAAAALCGISACYPYPRVQTAWPETRSLSMVHAGETRTARKDEIMFDRTDGSQVLPGFVLTRDIHVVGTDRQPVRDSGVWGARFRYAGSCPEGAWIITNPSFYEERVGIIVSQDGSIACNMPVVQLVGGQTGRTWQIDEQLPAMNVFDPVPFVAGFEPGAVRWQLVYRGTSGRKVNLEYVEYRGYVDDTAKPAFQQVTSFDLGATKTLSFRGTEIQVTRASDREISYRVVKDDLQTARADTRVETETYTSEPRAQSQRVWPEANREYDN